MGTVNSCYFVEQAICKLQAVVYSFKLSVAALDLFSAINFTWIFKQDKIFRWVTIAVKCWR